MSTPKYTQAMVDQYSTRTAASCCPYILPYLKPSMYVLDVGCGPGSITLDLASLVPDGRVVGLDFNSTAVDAARVAAVTRDDSKTKFLVGNILNLPFPDNTFDIVHAHQVLVHLPGSGPIDGLREMRRVCKPGGFVAARETEWDSAVIYPQIPGVLKTLKLLDELTRHNGTLWHGSRGRQWARLAGFSAHDIEASAAVVHYANSNATQWWGENMIKRLKSSALGDKLVETGIASQTELDEMCEDWNTWKDDEDAFHSRTDGQIVCRK